MQPSIRDQLDPEQRVTWDMLWERLARPRPVPPEVKAAESEAEARGAEQVDRGAAEDLP
jgi:hypothetical protein